eukprot:5778900-Prymnesium_polylepis.2
MSLPSLVIGSMGNVDASAKKKHALSDDTRVSSPNGMRLIEVLEMDKSEKFLHLLREVTVAVSAASRT